MNRNSTIVQAGGVISPKPLHQFQATVSTLGILGIGGCKSKLLKLYFGPNCVVLGHSTKHQPSIQYTVTVLEQGQNHGSTL